MNFHSVVCSAIALLSLSLRASGFGFFQLPVRCYYVKTCRGLSSTTTTTTTTTTSTTPPPPPSFIITPRRNMRSEDPAMSQGGPEPQDPDYWIRSEIGTKRLEEEYLLGDVIGRGGSSVVHKCLRKGRTEWACKTLKKSELDKKSVQATIPTLLELKHPNIVQIKEAFETAEEIHLILELANGGELFERIVERGHYSEEDAARAVRHILSALQYLHGHGVVHGDLKPENLLYQTEMEESPLKLADFGMNKLLSGVHQRAGRTCGTFGYSAPEVLLDRGFDASTDLWSLGVVAYIMLCGFEPFWDEGGEATMSRKIIEGSYSFPSPWWDEVSESAKELISKLLSIDPKSRPTAEEALNHPWTQGISTPTLHMNATVLRLREFNAKRRFRVATKAVLATRRALSLLAHRDGKTECGCLCERPADERTDESQLRTCSDCSSPDGCAADVETSFSSMSIDGRPVGKTPTKLATDFSSPYKGNYVGLG